MTSKEALEMIRLKLAFNGLYQENEYNFVHQIERDLEVLEILKPLVKAQKSFLDNGAIRCNKTFQKALNKVKEWLENDK